VDEGLAARHGKAEGKIPSDSACWTTESNFFPSGVPANWLAPLAFCPTLARMTNLYPVNKSAPLAPRIVRVTTAVVTVLALTGAVTTAALIFAVGLSVLWPVLIACACLTVLCAVGFLIAHCIIASGKTPSSFREVVEDYITFLKKMRKGMSLSDALCTLGNKKGIPIPENDIREICGYIERLVAQKTESTISTLTLGDLSSAHANKIWFSNFQALRIENLSNSLPIIIAILSLISSSRFFINKSTEGNWEIWSMSTDKKYSNSVKNYIEDSAYSVFNYGNFKSAPEDQQEITRETVKQIGRDNVFVTHYGGNGTLVIDPPPQAES
jgi:hypothetical protein